LVEFSNGITPFVLALDWTAVKTEGIVGYAVNFGGLLDDVVGGNADNAAFLYISIGYEESHSLQTYNFHWGHRESAALTLQVLKTQHEQ